MVEISLVKIDFDNLKPEDVFKWLEEFGFHRYGIRYDIDPTKFDDPRYPSELSTSKTQPFTLLNIPQQYYDETMFIIRKSDLERIKESFIAVLSKR